MTDMNDFMGVSGESVQHYTPTTEEVRKAWNMMPHDRYYKGNLVGQLASAEEFDRWLAEVKAEERKAERERIKQRLWDDGYLYEMERDHVWTLIEGRRTVSKSNMQKMQIPYTPTTEEVRNIFSWNNDEAEVDAMIGFDRWLAEIIREAKEEAWDEGYVSSDDYFGDHDNPYRQGEGSGKSSSQPTAETHTYLNRQEEEQ